MDSYEADELGRYTSLSSLAVCAFLLGLASLVALLSPLLVVVPIAGIIVSLLALLRINSSAGALSGTKLVYIALALSVVCVVAGPLRLKVRDRLYQSQADASAQEWLQLLAKAENQQALNGITGNAKMYLMAPPSPGGPPQTFDEPMYVAKLGEDPLATKLQQEAQHGELEFAVREFASNADGPNPRAEVTYQTVKPDDSLTMKLVLLRSISPSRGGEWLVDSWRLESEAAHDHAHPHSH